MATPDRIRALLVALVLVATTPAPAEPQAAGRARENAPEAPDYRIGPEDVLDIAVWNNTAISRTVPVRPDGKISVPLVNDVQAAGLTPMELRDVLMKELVEYIPAPEVSVIVREVRSFKVSVIGEVRKPGRYELKSGATVLDVLAMAEGFTEFAARSRVVVLRHEGGSAQRIPFSYNRVVSGDGVANFFLRPGDIVVVP